MKIRITAPGIYGGDGKEVEIGTILTVEAEPIGWNGRYEIVSDTKDKTPVTAAKPADKHKGDDA